MREINQLRKKNELLRNRVALLENEIQFIRTHPTIAAGLKGEVLAARLTGGSLTEYAAGHDVLVGTRVRIEVKFSKLNTPNLTAKTRRWNWGKPLGYLDKGKEYDFLLLIGEKDMGYPDQYLDLGPYVFFLLHRNDVPKIMTSGKTFGANVQLTTNFSTVKSPKSQFLISRMVPAPQVEELVRTSNDDANR